MKADRILEKLGYEKQEGYFETLVYKNKNYDAEIEFDLREQTILYPCNEETVAIGLDMEELQAIYKKCEELG